MAVPKHKPSNSRSKRRKAMNMKMPGVYLIECKGCGNMIAPHRICKYCGYYKDRQVIEPEKI